ncbi:glycoside hydrolase family 2 protein [Chamaesiphon minutus]|uniref:Beta-galactosidase/beta-glucuronidase n=1 Tax=Chamaesiphon minutus (strain ATCC 27169 / PCC 6605) TaxID=1173020 RepID=K9UCH7_CHAP6|nr:sugar-binding domain-containing protein [Chamaesiphon minutus]AFY92151.1 beta-galactosidase/beta-glucuronidase [Chamaesiphon minutus PCC 6605]
MIGISLTIAIHPNSTVATQLETKLNSTIPASIPLDGEWRFASGHLQPDNAYQSTFNDRNWRSIQVPGNWFLQGQDLSGVVWYRRHFQIDRSLKGKVIQLVFDGVDYTGDVWLNGHYLGFHEGYFQPFRFVVSDLLKYNGDNILAVKVNSPVEEPEKVWSLHKRLIKGVLNHHDTRPGGAWSVRGQEQNTGGIWAPVSLQISDRVAIIQQQVTPELDPRYQNGIAHIDLTIINPTPKPQTVKLGLQLQPANFQDSPDLPIVREQILQPGSNQIAINIPKTAPHLWWTWEHGKPDLYRVKTEILSKNKLLDRSSTTFGFRTIRLNPQSQVWELNGRRIFLRGTNYIASQWLSEMTRAKYSLDLKLMQQANINSIRVHAHIEAAEFYHLCDEMGLLVWQDFPLQWGYSDASEFVTEATQQANDMVTMLYNHPSIFTWSIHNEPPWDATWMKDKYRDYNPKQNRALDETIYNSLRSRDSTRHLHLASTTQEHPWHGWYSGKWQDYGKATKEPLITEFGAQALPNRSSLEKIFTAAELFPDTPAKLEKWKYHNFQPHETFNLAKVPMGKTVEEFIDNTQQYQAQLTQFAAESYRRQRYQPVSAIFQFMFVENWPSINWGIVDYWRQTKPGYEMLKRAYQPILPSIILPKQQWKVGESIPIELWLINDLWKSMPNSQLTYILKRSKTIIKQESIAIAITPDSSKQIENLKLSNLESGNYQLSVIVTDSQSKLLGENSTVFDVIKT